MTVARRAYPYSSSTLAIHGGTPVRKTMLPYTQHCVDASDEEAVLRALRSDRLTSGPEVVALEEEFAEFVGAKYAVAVSSGTAALHLAARVSGLAPGGYAVVPATTFVSTANCVLYTGATPLFADVRADALTIDPLRLPDLRLVQAILAMDYAGQPADLGPLQELRGPFGHRPVLIEDACHALGATYQGRPVGSIADITVFSLHPAKQVAAGEGGMLVTNREEWAARARVLRNCGMTKTADERGDSWGYDVCELGYNYRLSELHAALARSQLRKLPDGLARRRMIVAAYDAAFSQMPALEVPTVLPDRESAWHLYVLRFDSTRRPGLDRMAPLFHALRAENIGVNIHYIPVPMLSLYWRHKDRPPMSSYPVAHAQYARMLTLPLFPAMTDSDVEDVIVAVKKVLAHYDAAA